MVYPGRLFFLGAAALLGSFSSAQVYKDPSQPVQKRVDDLVSRMTLEEKVSQMQNTAPAVERLGIPAYQWWSEALHGVVGNKVTVYPQAIGLGATWDPGLIDLVGTAISDEGRARYNIAIQSGSTGMHEGLTFWAPNINIFRDPRWGRGQETYGEDPFLTGTMATHFVRAMQGHDPHYLKAVATPKHYAVHSGPDPMRHKFNAVASVRDLRLTYLAAFEACVRDANAWSVMSAYSSYDGVPCPANALLLQHYLRDTFGFKGYVVSDCGAIDDVFYGHHFTKSIEAAAADSVKAGTDLECGSSYGSLVKAVNEGLITEAEIDRSVKRLFEARIRLGMFDPPSMVPFSKLSPSVVDSKPHKQLALRAAHESIVLLKNEGNLLPLPTSVRTIAVVGPNANDPGVLYGNYNGIASSVVTPLQGIKNAVGPKTRVLYSRGTGLTHYTDLTPIPSSAFTGGLKAEFFGNQDLKGDPILVRTDSDINFDWGDNAPTAGVPQTHYSIRWTGKLVAPASGMYQIGGTSDDGMRVYIDGKRIVDNWSEGAARTVGADVSLVAGHTYDVKVEFFQNGGEAVAKLVWTPPTGPVFGDALDIAKQSDVVVAVLGISNELEGEEHDRSEITLPRVQEDLLKALEATRKPVVLVLVNGGPVSTPWAAGKVAAIVESWYGGQSAGTALADVLFGRYNPAGRLPVSIYRDLSQIPDFTDYDMSKRTYRYSKQKPLFPFGFGLSYTRFRYSDLRVSAPVSAGQPIEVSVGVTNVGPREGDEVVQLYLSHGHPSLPMPRVALKGLGRVHLRAGESKRLKMSVPAADYAVVHEDGTFWTEPEDISIFVGGSQPNVPGSNGVKGKAKVGGLARKVKN